MQPSEACERVKSPPLKAERWRRLPIAPGYMVSDRGGVCGSRGLLKPDIDARGRKRATICSGGVAKKFLVAHLVLIAFVGPCPEGMECCHRVGSHESSTLLEDVRWDTRLSNCHDKKLAGTQPVGERGNHSSLKESDVRRIREVGYPLKQHAERYGVTETTVSHILKRKTWTHI